MEESMSKPPIIESYGTNYYLAYIKYDKEADDYYIQLPYELTLSLGWEVGDEIEFDIKEKDKLYICKKRDNANE